MQVVGGRKKFIAQFNRGWSRDFMPRMGKNKSFCQEDVFKFSWMERQEELLFSVASGEKSNAELVLSAAVPDCALLIAINVRHCLSIYSTMNSHRINNCLYENVMTHGANS